ncbi:Maf family nucleotide pyrophosphatase [Neopusillimonas maritima]|jgi:septum formation protein|uniref:7-methyl-GTP pyrophosphatase n=1 Tax=Neopusillimonas maritima TaxID=2026239 RepID=A0A3A1YUE4_9BURK|nr:Maf family nucleotide pyrophosphatase [Neopusillimonas maritima]RII84107.1 septum formation protein Maf [Neopusillimonas maritima]RIY40889.1 septum formation protein Maf [Neopusillimonas maritima]|tara:strand:- start:448 stop:1032 length:585 start_codon:yes stop_codon:yes gene_type:complete
MRLILASSSPYRRALLERLRLPFETIAPDIDETPLENESPVELALRLAKEKATVIAKISPSAVVIGSDQVATINGVAIGKPGNHERAMNQLKMLSGQTVMFHTALCVSHEGVTETENIVTHCRFRVLNEAEIHYYLDQEKPYDTAGSAKAESLGITLMEHIRSDDPTAIIGLPLITLSNMLRRFNINPLQPDSP